jgi:hypothetical protein
MDVKNSKIQNNYRKKRKVEPNTLLPIPKMTPEELKWLQIIAEKYGQKLYPPDYFD